MSQSIDALGSQANYSVPTNEAAKPRAEAPVASKVEVRRSEPEKKAVTPTDEIEVSLTAQVKLLKSQGLSVSMIAGQLGLDSETVTQYISGY